MQLRRPTMNASRREVVMLAALLLALSIAYVVPLAAVVVVWPALFVVPGWALLTWTGARFTGLERAAVAILLSVGVSSHLVYWLSLVTGSYDRSAIFVASVLLLAPLATRSGWPRPDVGAFLTFLARERTPLALAGIGAAFVGVLLAVSIWQVDASGLSTTAVLWSDLLVHLSIAQSVNAGNFPPDVPFYAGAPLTYHWFSDFHAAIAARAAGLFPIPIFVVSSALLTASLALAVFALARRLTGSRRAAAIALVLAIFGGGMGYLRFFGDWYTTRGDAWQLLTGVIYDNRWLTDWPYFRVPSVMGTGLLSHRATTAGLPMLVCVVLLLVIGLRPRRTAGSERPARARDRPRVILLAGLLAAVIAPFHFFLFPAALLLALLYVVAAGRTRDLVGRNAALFLGPLVVAVPHVVVPLALAGGANRIQLHLWWDAPAADGPAAVAFFYATNLGVPFVLALVALLRPSLPARAFLAAWIVAMFAIPNLASFSAITFDMNKYFQAMWMATAIAAAWLVRRWHPAAIALVLIASVASPLQVGLYAVSDRYGVLSAADLSAARWAVAEAPPRSVFVTDGWLHSFTDVAGRLRLTSFSPYIANLGYDPGPREAMVREIYCGGDVERSAELMGSLGADYVVDSGRPADCAAPVDFGAGPLFSLAFEEGHLRIWQLTSGSGSG
ncbi:MAG: hypothetical protein ACRDGJ_11820 [Candidatus Limnocylindria bacterium]